MKKLSFIIFLNLLMINSNSYAQFKLVNFFSLMNYRTTVVNSLDYVVATGFCPRVYEFNKGNPKEIRHLNNKQSSSATFSNDGKFLAVAQKGINIYKIIKDKFILETTLDEVLCNAMAFSPDSKLFVTGGSDTILRIYLVKGGKFSLIKTIKDQKGRILALSFSPDGKYLAVGGEDSVVNIYSIENKKIVFFKAVTNISIYSMAFAPNGVFFAVGGMGKLELFLVDDGRFTFFSELSNHTFEVSAVAFSYSGNYFASCSFDHTAKIYHIDDRNFELVKTLETPKALYSVSFYKRNDEFLLITGFEGTRIYKIENDN